MKQILYRIKSLFLLVAIAGGISACADDKGNYNYHDIPEVKIEGIGSSIQALAYQNLSIPVQLDGLEADEDRYEYEWLAIRQFEAEDANDSASEVLATTKEFNDIISLRPGPYKLIYTVKDKHLNVFYQQQANLSVVTTTSEGWVLLCSENGNVRLDMISTVLGEEVHSKDMLADSDMPFKKGPLALIALDPGSLESTPQVDPISPFYLLTEEGTTRLHKDAFEWKEEYLMKYEMGDMSDAKSTHITSAGYFRMMVTPDGIHSSNFGSGTEALWESQLNYLRNDNNTKEYIQVAPYVGCNITNSMQMIPIYMFYDLDHKQFVYHPGGMYGALGDPTVGCLNMSDEEAEGNVFTFPIGYNYIYMENSGRKYSESAMMPGFFNNITFTILVNNGIYHLYGIALDDFYVAMVMSMPAYTKTHYANLSNCTDITQAEHFAFSPLNDQMFYAVDGKVYRVNLDTSTPSSEFQFEVPGEITCLKFYLYRNAENARRSYDLIVGSDKGGTDGGELRVYEAVDNLAQITDYKEYHSGFGRIVDIIYKEPLTQE